MVANRGWRDGDGRLRVGVSGIDASELLSVRHAKATSVRSVQVGGRRLAEEKGCVSRLPVIERLLERSPDGRSQRRTAIGLQLGGWDVGKRGQRRDGCLRDQGDFLRVLGVSVSSHQRGMSR